jgi:hypothetical protein
VLLNVSANHALILIFNTMISEVLLDQ